jgi:hypothetical protein
MLVYWKIASSEPASWTFGTSATTGYVAQVAAVQNPGDVVTPFDGTNISSNLSQTGVIAPALSPAIPNDLLLGFFGTKINTTFTPDAAMTEVQDQASTTVCSLETAWQAITATGNTGPRVATAGAAAVNIGWLGAIKPPSSMPSYRDSSQNWVGGTASAIALKPAATQDGDLLLAGIFVAHSTAAPTITGVPAGWTLRDSVAIPNGQMGVYWKIAASEPSQWSWAVSVSANMNLQVIAIQNPGDLAAPIDVSVIQANASSVNVSAPSLTQTRANSMMVGFFAVRANTTFTPDANMFEMQDAGTSLVTQETAIEQRPTIAATGARTAVAAIAGQNIAWLGIVKGPPDVLASPAGRGDPFFWSL